MEVAAFAPRGSRDTIRRIFLVPGSRDRPGGNRFRNLLLEAEESDDDDEDPDLPEWQKREWEIAKLIVFSDRFPCDEDAARGVRTLRAAFTLV